MHEGLYETREKCMRETIEYFDKWNGSADGRIQVWFGCRSVTEHNNLSLYDEVGQLSRERGIGITIHLSEEESGIAYANRLGYPTLTHAVHEHGLLGPHTVLVHFTASLQEDWEICAKTGTHVSHCPGVVAGSQWVQLPIVRLIDLGINVSLGCDNSANGLDLLRDLRIACYVSRNAHNDRESILAEKVLELATINGAKAMGIHDQVGSIEAGKRADFIVIDTDSPNLVPYWDPITAIVYNAHGSDVHTVVIDGRIIVQCKKILTLDEDAILDDIKRRYLQIARRAGISPDPYRSIWPIE
jgi:cytosine/adenosine deaminase-related metal-dependent hydrolase